MKRARPTTDNARESRWPWFLILGLITLLIVTSVRDVGLPGDRAGELHSDPFDLYKPTRAKGPVLATHVSIWPPAELLERALAGSKPAWRMLHAQAFSKKECAELKGKLVRVLATAVHPTAIYRGGSDAVRLAAKLADPRLCEHLLSLLSHWEGVVMKLPLTELRDDLLVLEAVRAGVEAAGTRAQRTRLAALLPAIERIESMNVSDVEEDARTETRER